MGDVSVGHWLLWVCLPSWALAYGVVGSSLTREVRAVAALRSPRGFGALLNCAVCTTLWTALLLAVLDRMRVTTSPTGVESLVVDGDVALLWALASAGAMWLFSALTAALARIATGLEAIARAVAWRGSLDACADEKRLRDLLGGLEDGDG